MAATTNGHTHASTNAVEQDDLHIPLIDISPLLSSSSTPEQRLPVAQAILAGFQDAGFLYLTNHSISSTTIANVFNLSARFFALPQSTKNELSWYSAAANRGYTRMGREKVSQLMDKADVAQQREEECEDLKESLEIGRDDEGPGKPNMWPDILSDAAGAREFRDKMVGFFDECKGLHRTLMRAVGLALGIDEGWFDDFTAVGDNTLRLLHYPPVKRSVFRRNQAQVRAGAHSDYGSITLLFQDERGGLQVKSPKGTFVFARPIPGTIVVNAGDLLARWSNDLIKSTVHRVVEPPLAEESDAEARDEYEHPARYSIAYFCNPDFHKFIDVIPNTLAQTQQQKKYEGVNSGEYLVRRLEATY